VTYRLTRLAYDLWVKNTRQTLADQSVCDAPLFAPHTRARLHDAPTSHAAAAQAHATEQRRLIVVALTAHGPMTADDIDMALGWRPTTAGRRMAELAHLGAALTTGATRPTRSGRAAEVWTLTAIAGGREDQR
jgi:hypothetical protein